MKLFQLVMWRMSTILVVILTCWAVLFYLAIMEEAVSYTHLTLPTIRLV